MTIVSTVNGMNQQSLKQFEAMGTNRIDVQASLYNGQNAFEPLYDYCNSLGSDLVLGVTPDANFGANVVYGSKSSKTMEKNQEIMWNSDGGMNSNLRCRRSCGSAVTSMRCATTSSWRQGRDLSKIDIKNL